MPSIAELKSQYPDLATLDDEQVVDAVHEAFYRDMPRESVAKSLGVKPASAPVEPRSWSRVAGDVGISALKGAIAVPEAAVGLADLATGGRAGKLAEEVGFRPKEAKAMLDEGYSDPQKEAFRKVQTADGLGDTFMAAVQNPSVIGHSVVESLPSMGAGGVLARGGLALAPKVGGVTAAALGEGAVATGSAAEQIRQQSADGLLTGKQSLLAGATGATTTAFSMLGGKIAKKLGLADVDTMLAGAATYPAMRKGVVRSMLEGAVAEGVLEELPQSVSEQVLQNIALDKPLDEGVNQAAVLGLLSGAAMGGGVNALNSFGGQPAPGVIPVEPAGPLARAAGAVAPGTAEAMAGPAPAPVDDPVADTIASLPEGIREQAQRAYAVINNPDAAKGVRSYNQKLLDGLLDQVAGDVATAQDDAQKEAEALTSAAETATKTIAPVTTKTDPETGEITTAYDQRQADAPKQEEGDILNAENKPFTNMAAAKKTARALGDGYAPFRLGVTSYVVRAKPVENTDVSPAPSIPDVPAAAGGRGGVEPTPSLATELGSGAVGAGTVDAGRAGDQPGGGVVSPAGGETDAAVAQEPAAQEPLNVQNPAPGAAKAETQTETGQAPEAGAPAAAGQPAAGTEAGDTAVQAAGVEKTVAGPASLGSVKADMDHLFRVPEKRAAALDRIAAGKAWFGDSTKARAFLTKNGLKETHTFKQSKPGRFDIVEKDSREDAAAVTAPATPSATPELVKIRTLQGINTHVRKSDLDGDASLIRMFTATGKSNGRIHRDNLDPTGEKQAAQNTQDAGNPFFDVITAKQGAPFATVLAARRELNTRALSETHEVVPASEVKAGAPGFVVRKKSAGTPATRPDNGQDDWKVLGRNKDGKMLVQDKRGVRSYVENGIRITESVTMRPTRAGMELGTEHKGEFLTTEEAGVEPDATLRALSHDVKKDGDVKLGNGKFVTLEQAKAAALKHMTEKQRGMPFQYNNVLDIAPTDWDRMVSAMSAPQNSTDVQDTIKGAVSTDQLTNEQVDQVAAMFDKRTPKASVNTIFTEDAAAAARAILKKKLGGTLNSGIDPELLQAGITLAGYHIEKGARTFTAFAKAMIADLGDGIRPYLKQFYMAVKYDPRATDLDGMDDAAAMEAVNLDKIAIEADTEGPKDGNAAPKLDRAGESALEGAPSQDVRAPDESRDAGNSPDGGSASDLPGDARADDTGRDADRGMGAGAGAVPVSARGTGTGRKAAAKPRLPRAPRADAGPGLFGDVGGLTPDAGPNPAPNAPAIPAPQVKAEDFTITDELALGEGGQKAKFKNNVAAIRLLADLEKTGRLATPDEQAVLAKYVGWGGLPQAFDANNADWAKEFAEITALMTPQELADARQSTRYAHYTSREIIVDGIYAAMRRFGFNGGKTLEAGAGVGNFLGLMPADMRSAGRFTAIEREPFSSAIARQLYPQQNVQRADFAEFKGTDAYYDAAVGNPPFASDPQTDRSGRKHLSGLSLHNYFFAKSVDMLREGGIMAQVITNAFMDAKTETARKYIGERTRLLGAIRLPNSAFAKNANTEVTTDIVFLQKLPDSEIGGKAARADAKRWLSIGQYRDNRGRTVALNQYFIDNPGMMLGDFGAHGSMYGPDFPALIARPGQNTLALLKEAVGKLPEGVYKSIAETGAAEHTQAAITALKNPSVSEGGYFLDGDKLMQRLPDIAGEARGVQITPETQWTEKTKLGDAGFERIKALAGMRSTVRGLIAAEMSDDTNAMTSLRATLNEQYDGYRDTHGLINDPSTLRVFEDDPDFPLLASLEHGYTPGIGLAAAKRMGVKPTKSTAKKGPIFSQRVVAARQKVSKVETPADALQVSMAERGKLDAGYIGELLGKEPEAVLKELSSGAAPLLFRDPATDEYVLRDAYLSGNVRAKLAQANAAGMFSNVTALEAVQPPEVASHEIVARLGSPWVPTSVYRDFAQSLFGEDSTAVVTYLKANSSYQLYVTGASSVALTNTWGTPAYPGDKMLNALLNNRSIKVTYIDADKKTRTDIEATETANTKAQELKDRFADWLFSDADRSEILTKAYNETNNNYVTRVYDGSNMTFPGKVPDSIIKFRRHQRNAIARIVQDRTALLDHVVGAGKTFTIVAGAMELKRTGLARKTMVAVPNHLVKQWAADFYRLYPGANVLTATKKDFEKSNRRKFLARIATGDWDAVVIAHSSYGFIKPAPEFEAAFNDDQIRQIMATIKAVDDSDGEKQTKKRTIKQLEAMKEKLENRIRSLRDKPMDDLLDFEQLGVDQLFVDEAHLFKNLMFSTKMQQVQGLGDSAGSQRAYDMYVKAHQIYAKNGRGQGVVFATGTPVSNSLAEMYHMMRYLMPAQMKELGFESFDAWANTFASVEQVWMQAPSGDGFKASNRMSNFVNTTELLKMFDQVSDTVTMDDIKKAYSEENDGAEFPLPKLKGGRRTPVSLDKSPAQDAYMLDIAKRAKEIEQRRGPPKKGDDNILVVMGDARKAAMDIRLVDPTVTEREKGGRIDTATDRVLERYKQYDKVKGTQIVFSDLGTPIKHAKAELKEYEALQARIAAGDEETSAKATFGDENAIAVMEDVESAQAELDGKGQDWLGAVQSALRGFSVYDDFRAALVEKGVPDAEIAFIHDYNTDDQKATLFRKVNAGHIRVLLGSTQKLGAGTNVQERLVAEHHLDVPWRPSDVEQREGRIERQGNVLMTEVPNFEIEILAYVTKDTLDMRMWQVQENKLKMINQLRTRKISREIDNAFEDMELSAGEMQAAATGDINLLKEIQLRNDVKKLEQKRRSFEAQRNDLITRKKRVAQNLRELPAKVERARAEAGQAQAYFADLRDNLPPFKMDIDGKTYTSVAEAQAYLLAKTEAKVESIDLAGEKTMKAAPLSVEMNGELFKSRAALQDAFAEVRGDAEPILWSFNGTDYRRRSKIATAIRQNGVDSIADETVKPVGTIAGYTVNVEGQVIKAGGMMVDVTMSRDGKVVLSKEIVSEDAARMPDRVVRVVENMLESAVTEVDYLERSLARAQKDAADLDGVAQAGAWPEEAKLEAARAAHKEILAKLKSKDPAAKPEPGADEVMFSRSKPGALKAINTPAGTAFQGDDIVLGKPRLNVKQPGGDVTRIDFELRDPVAFAKARAAGETAAAARDMAAVGILTMDMDKGGQFKSLRNIEIFESKRGSGLAEKVVGSIMASLPETSKLHIHEILPTAVGFWDKMGAKFPRSEEYMEAFLTPQQFRSAHDTRATQAGKKGSPGEPGEALFRRGRESGRGPDGKAVSGQPEGQGSSETVEAQRATAEVERIVAGITSRWANSPNVVVAYDMNDPRIPERVRTQDQKQRSGGATGTPEGFFFKGTAYVMSSQVTSQQDVARVLFHEALGHAGLRGNFGDELKPILAQIAALRRKDVAAKATEYGLDMADEAQRLQAAEEVLAVMAQETPDIGYVKRAIAIIRTWLRKNVPGFKNMKLTDAEIIENYILPARGWVERGRADAAALDLTPAFSKAAQTDTPAFKKWFGDSKVVDADGKPLVVLHGTRENFTEFDRKKSTSGLFGTGFYFTDNRGMAEDYADGGNVMEVYLSIQNPAPRDVANRVVDQIGEDDADGIRAELERLGYDGVMMSDAGELLVVAFNPEQIKSAIGNNGDFDPANADVRFSRSLPAAMASAMNSAHDVKLPAGYVVHDFFKADGKLSWWHKTVGTQYNLAQRNPAFKKVFDRTQDFINDVSFYATDAADLAPSILPKLETWKDITKTSITAADNKAIAAPIFEGTLVWMRDAKGKAVPAADVEAAAATMSADDKAQRLFREDKISEGVLKMWRGLPVEQYEALVNGKYERDMLKPGIVFTPAELRDLYKLTDQQIALYGEFRAAVDKSLTNMAVADMVRFGGADVAAVRDQALAMGDVDAAAVLLRDHLLDQAEGSDRAGVLVDTAEKMIDKADKARDLMDRGYAPLSRFGSYSLDVVDESGERVYFGLFESKAEANRMARQMRGNFPGATINQGTMSDEEYKLFAGVTPETIELFGEMLGLESEGSEASNQAFQQYLKLAKANRSAMKRLIQRKGIAGFSEDPGRVLAGFVYSNARQTSSGLHMGGISEAVRDIPKGQGELKDAAVRLMDYVKNPQEEAQKIRGLLFAQYLGGSIASAMVNLMQPVNVTFPWLSQHGGIIKAAGQLKNAAADALKKSTGDATLDAALKKAAEDGIVSPQEVFQLMAQAQGKGTLKPGDGTTTGNAIASAENALSKMSLAWGKVFGLAEQFNRRTTFIAAYRTAVEQKMADPAAFAERAVNETQFVYNKGAKPRWARGAVGGILFTFKSYSINYVEMLSRMANSGPEGRKAALLALGVLFLMSGAGGLPFAEDIEDVLDGLMQRLGYNFSSKQAKQEFLIGLMGRPGADFVERGISGLAGVPIDVSGRLGMGNLLPGTGLLTKKVDRSRDLLELAGPAGDLAKRTLDAAGKLVDGNILGRTGAIATLSPTAIRNLIQANDMANTGLYRDTKGKKVLDVDAYDVMVKAIGFQPNDVARVQEATGMVINMVGQNKMRESEIADMWAQGVFEGDTAKVERARDALKRWNEANPTAPIKLQMPQIIKRVKAMREDKATRIARTAPKEIRATVRRELAAE